MTTFEVARSDSLLFERCDTSRDLLLMFSGRPAGFRNPWRFHFQAMAAPLEVNKLYLRDCFGIWYHGGLEGHTRAITDTAAFLADFIEQQNIARVRTLGVSTGGYASLLFGALLGADRVYAIAPRTFLDPANRDRYGDWGMDDAFAQLYSHPFTEPDYYDLKKVLHEHHQPGRRYRIFFDPEAERDLLQAEHVADVPEIEFSCHPGAGHAVVSDFLRDPRQLFDGLVG